MWYNPEILKAAADVLLKQITDEIKDAEGFAVIADEARDISKKEQLSLCLRYMNKDLLVNERFVGFSDLCDLDGQALSSSIMVDPIRVSAPPFIPLRKSDISYESESTRWKCYCCRKTK